MVIIASPNRLQVQSPSSSVLSNPGIWYFNTVGIYAIFIWRIVIVYFCRTIDDNRLMFAYTFKPVSNHRRYLYQNRIVCTCNKLIYLSKSRGIFPAIVKNNLHHTMYNSKMVCFYLMIMPCLYNTRIGRRHIYLAKFYENFVIFSKYLHQSAAFIRDGFEFFYLYTINHGRFPLYFLFTVLCCISF